MAPRRFGDAALHRSVRASNNSAVRRSPSIQRVAAARAIARSFRSRNHIRDSSVRQSNPGRVHVLADDHVIEPRSVPATPDRCLLLVISHMIRERVSGLKAGASNDSRVQASRAERVGRDEARQAGRCERRLVHLDPHQALSHHETL